MKITINGKEIDTKKIDIAIGALRFRLQQSIGGKLNINKTWGYSDDGSINIHPRYGNEIEVD